MFKPQDLIQGVELGEKSSPEVVDESGRGAVALMQVRLKKEDLAEPKTLYRGIWHFLFVDPEWYSEEKSRLSLAKIFPAYFMVKFKTNPFREEYFSSPGIYSYINDLLRQNFVMLPVVKIKPRLKILGMNLNYAGTEISTKFYLSNVRVEIVDQAVNGKFYPGESRATSNLLFAHGKGVQTGIYELLKQEVKNNANTDI